MCDVSHVKCSDNVLNSSHDNSWNHIPMFNSLICDRGYKTFIVNEGGDNDGVPNSDEDEGLTQKSTLSAYSRNLRHLTASSRAIPTAHLIPGHHGNMLLRLKPRARVLPSEGTSTTAGSQITQHQTYTWFWTDLDSAELQSYTHLRPGPKQESRQRPETGTRQSPESSWDLRPGPDRVQNPAETRDRDQTESRVQLRPETGSWQRPESS